TRYPDGHLYADLGGRLHGPVPPSVVLDGWLEALGCQEIPDELAERTSLFRQVTAGSHIAVLVDNAISAAQVRPLLPSSERSLTVVTSQWLL
ncbi:regulator, partial [Escherichia coli]|nr:regulator [Escherichia coli]